MSKTRRRPDGTVWVRTLPVTFLHDRTQLHCDPDWHHLTYAIHGHLEVTTEEGRHVVPADRAIWVPAGTQHATLMRAPVSMRSLFVARGVLRNRKLERRVRTFAVTPLLRELMLYITRLGALDVRKPTHLRLFRVLFDLLESAEEAGLALPLPRDPRARALAELVTRTPGDPRSTAQLARLAGASLRTLERCFVRETGLGIGAFRRRVRLFHALRLLESGATVTSVALDVGYSTVSAFSQAFRAQFGRSPTGRLSAMRNPAGRQPVWRASKRHRSADARPGARRAGRGPGRGGPSGARNRHRALPRARHGGRQPTRDPHRAIPHADDTPAVLVTLLEVHPQHAPGVASS